MEKEQVNHPSHYCQHPAGIECIDVIRNYVCDIANALKYLWRAGLKEEMGKDDIEKEIEDLKRLYGTLRTTLQITASALKALTWRRISADALVIRVTKLQTDTTRLLPLQSAHY